MDEKEIVKSISCIIPPEGDKQVGKKVFTLLGEIIENKKSLGLHEKWKRHYELYRNRHFRGDAGNKIPLISANFVFDVVSSTVNVLSDNNPTFNIFPHGNAGEFTKALPKSPPPQQRQQGEQQGPPDPEKQISDTLDALHKTTTHWWNETEQQRELQKTETNGEIYGITVNKVIFDPKLEMGIGEVKNIIVDPYHFGLYPITCHEVQDAIAVFHYYPITLIEARQRWPEFAARIYADSDYLKDLGDDRRELASGTGKVKPQGYTASISGAFKTILGGEGDSTTDAQQCLIVECWVKDYTMVTEEMQQPMIPGMLQPMTQVISRPKYKGFIRCITACNNGDLVLSDVDNPSVNSTIPDDKARITYLYDKFPYIKTLSIEDTSDPWGMSIIEQVKDLNIEFDKTISQICLLKDKISRLKILNPKDSGVDNTAFTNSISVVNPATSMAAQSISFMKPPEIPDDLYQCHEIFKQIIFHITGTLDLQQFEQIRQEAWSGKALSVLIENAALKLRGKIRNYSRMIREIGRMYLSHVMNWYSENRWITFEINGEQNAMPIKGIDLIMPLKLSVVTGSTLPVSKAQQKEDAVAMMQAGLIDQEEALSMVDKPNRFKIMERMSRGPIGDLMGKLQKVGMPQPIMQAIQAIAAIPAQQIDRAMERKEVPNIQSAIQQVVQQGPSPEEQKKQAEVQKIYAEIQKIQADIQLVSQKVNSELVDQQVKQHGVNFDTEKLDIEKAKVASDIQSTRHYEDIDGAKEVREIAKTKSEIETVVPDDKEQQGYVERGLKSNNY